MADILSQEEINALLEVVEECEESCDYRDIKNRDNRQVILYDFRRPNIVSKEELRYVKKIHDIFSMNLVEKLKDLNIDTEIQLHSVDQVSFGEFLMNLEAYPNIKKVIIKPFNSRMFLQMDYSLFFPLLEQLLGNDCPKMYDCTRELSELEQNIYSKTIIPLFLNSLENSWKESDFEGLNFHLKDGLEKESSSCSMIKSNTKQNEIVIHVVLEVIFGNCSGMINLAYCFDDIEDYFFYLKTKGVINE